MAHGTIKVKHSAEAAQFLHSELYSMRVMNLEGVAKRKEGKNGYNQNGL
jgi:hypothetical protein